MMYGMLYNIPTHGLVPSARRCSSNYEGGELRMAKPSVQIKMKLYGGLDLVKEVSDLLFMAAVDTQNKWRGNIELGQGAMGAHGRPYVDQGEAKNDVVISPQGTGSMKYAIGGDVVQLFIAEYGRVPTPGRLPPFEPIAEWATRKGITNPAEKDFVWHVNNIRKSISEYGLAGFAPGLGAAIEVNEETQKKLKTFVEDAIKKKGLRKV